MENDFRTQAPVANLIRRSQLLAQLRRFFDERGFVEVQTPVLSRETIVDRHLDPIELEMQLPGDIATSTWYLQTSPEQSMKRLLASGLGSIYQIGPVFRMGELGRLHNPEFIMAEWYEVGAKLDDGLRLLDDLLAALLGTPRCTRLTFQHAMQSATGIDVLQSDVGQLARWSVANALVDHMDWSNDWDDWVNLIFSERVQSTLGTREPVLITHFPASQAALAIVSPEDRRTAERYELFYRGVELANGYHELMDAEVLSERARRANQERVLDGKGALPESNRLLDAMRAGMPTSCGCALGFDRLVMLACDAIGLDEVIAFRADRA